MYYYILYIETDKKWAITLSFLVLKVIALFYSILSIFSIYHITSPTSVIFPVSVTVESLDNSATFAFVSSFFI